MKIKKQYETNEERELLISEFAHLILIEEHNTDEGNFLVFSDAPNSIYLNVPQQEFIELREGNTQINADIGNLLLESVTDKMTIATLEDAIGNLLLEVAIMKGGAA